MKSLPLLLIPICLLMWPALVSSSDQGIARDVQWNRDLDYLVERLEIAHPNLYATVSAEDFHKNLDGLRHRLPKASDVEMVYGIQELRPLNPKSFPE